MEAIKVTAIFSAPIKGIKSFLELLSTVTVIGPASRKPIV